MQQVGREHSKATEDHNPYASKSGGEAIIFKKTKQQDDDNNAPPISTIPAMSCHVNLPP